MTKEKEIIVNREPEFFYVHLYISNEYYGKKLGMKEKDSAIDAYVQEFECKNITNLMEQIFEKYPLLRNAVFWEGFCEVLDVSYTIPNTNVQHSIGFIDFDFDDELKQRFWEEIE